MAKPLKGTARYAALARSGWVSLNSEPDGGVSDAVLDAQLKELVALANGVRAAPAAGRRDGSRTLEKVAAQARRATQRALALDARHELLAVRRAGREADAMRCRWLLIGQAVSADMQDNPHFAALVYEVLGRRITRKNERERLGLTAKADARAKTTETP